MRARTAALDGALAASAVSIATARGRSPRCHASCASASPSATAFAAGPSGRADRRRSQSFGKGIAAPAWRARTFHIKRFPCRGAGCALTLDALHRAKDAGLWQDYGCSKAGRGACRTGATLGILSMLIGIPRETRSGRDARRGHARDGQEARRERQALKSSSRPAPARRPRFPTNSSPRPARRSAAPPTRSARTSCSRCAARPATSSRS